MRKKLTRLSSLLACMIAGALVLTACGSGGSSDNGGSSEKKTDTTITGAIAYDNTTLNPVSASTVVGLSANWHVMEGLYDLDMTTFKPYKALAKGDPKKITDTQYEVELRDGAKYSDGSDVKASDVVNAWKLNTSEDGLYKPMLSFIKQMTAKDDKTVVIDLEYPFALLKERLSLVKVFPEKMKEDELTKQPIGSGPYKYESVSEKAIDFVANDKYNGDKPAKSAKMHWDMIKDGTARATAIQSGSVQAIESVPNSLESLVTSSGASVDKVQGFNLPFLMFNTKKKPFDDMKVRQAFFYAIDIDKLVKNAMNGEATPATSFLPKDHPNYHKAKMVYSYDPEKAKSLLKEAGVSDLSITLDTTDTPWIKAISPQVKNDLEKVGIKTKLVEQASASLYANKADVDNPTFDVVLAPGDPTVFGRDPDLLLNWWYGDNTWTHKRSQWYGTDGFKQLQDLMHKAVTSEGKEQQENWNKAFDLISEQVPIYPLFHRQIPTGYYKDKLDNFKPIGVTGLYFLGVEAKE